jgi:predicted ABC-type ATPase
VNIQIPRLRIFAGPNGSGKSTLQEVISKELLGVYINPDEIEKEIKEFDFLDLTRYGIQTDEEEILSFFAKSTLLKKADLLEEADYLKFADNKLIFSNLIVNAYFASVCADFIRKSVLSTRRTFTFETVMSSYDKVEFLELAQKFGYRTYLYYIATHDPLINVSRVKYRVSKGGHDVPEDKIISRYGRSLENLWPAIQYSNRAYIFDNSSHYQAWICEITEEKKLDIKQHAIPQWLDQYVIAKMKNQQPA